MGVEDTMNIMWKIWKTPGCSQIGNGVWKTPSCSHEHHVEDMEDTELFTCNILNREWGVEDTELFT